MNKSKKISEVVTLTANLTGIVTLLVSIAYVVASAIALIYYSNCSTPIGDGVFPSVYQIYLQDPSCHEAGSTSYAEDMNLTSPYSVYIMVILTLTASVLCTIAASTLLFATFTKEGSQFLTPIIIFYIAAFVISLVVDITFATHFGLDYSHLTALMSEEETADSVQWLRLLRIGVMLLVTISLKGFVVPLFTLVRIVLLAIYLYKHQKLQTEEGHSIHKLGSLYAYRDDKAPNSPPLQNRTNTIPPSPSPVPTLNMGFESNEPSLPRRDIHDYKYNRSVSDQPPDHQSAYALGSRPFSYLEDPRPASPLAKFTRSSSNIPEHIHVPDPDYSPIQGRRLKSALKNTYI